MWTTLLRWVKIGWEKLPLGLWRSKPPLSPPPARLPDQFQRVGPETPGVAPKALTGVAIKISKASPLYPHHLLAAERAKAIALTDEAPGHFMIRKTPAHARYQRHPYLHPALISL